jgi:formylglycine-generating enzyme required for sulfatase activity
MRRIILLLVFSASMLPALARAQGPTPPPGLPELCYPEGGFPALECFKAVWDRMGLWGVVILGAVILIVYLFVTPAGKAFQSWVQEKTGDWLRSVSKPLPSVEVQRREAEYLSELERSETIRGKAEKLAAFDEYLHGLQSEENPLKPSEDRIFVDLESGLSVEQRIGLSVKSESQQTKSFVELRTFASLAEAVNHVNEQTGRPYPALALLGEPGAGKSTLLRQLARQAVRERKEDPSKPLPLFVSLSEHKNGSPLVFLRRLWKQKLGYDGFDNALVNEGVWLFLDGLNEMPSADYHSRVGQWRDFMRALPEGNRAVVACRIADYGKGLDLPRLTIHPMDEERIRRFLEKRAPERAEALWEALKKDRGEGYGRMYELAQIPFWLVMISSLSGKDGLPSNRAHLLDQSIDRWLDYERNVRIGGLKINDDQCDAFKKAMIHLAWTGLSRSQNYTFEMDEARKLLGAKQTLLNADIAVQLAKDCNLLVVEPPDKPAKARFHHQLLQEYFAAYELAQRFLARKDLSQLWKIPWRNWKFVESDWDPLPPPPQTDWAEAVVLAAGLLRADEAERFALSVLPHNPPLAARCILESGMKRSDAVVGKIMTRLQSNLENPRVRLPARLAAGKMLAKLGDPRLLARRGEAELTEGKKTIFIAPDWLDVPAGSFRMGTTSWQARLSRWQRADVYASEQPAHFVQISAFRIARFPVAVAEYRCFMDAGGYENDSYWREENSLRWRNAPLPFEESYYYQFIRDLRERKEAVLKQVDNLVQRRIWSPAQADAVRDDLNREDADLRAKWERFEIAKRSPSGRVMRPLLWDTPQYTVDNQPVVGVSWYEACAYAAWLTELLRMQGAISEQEEIRLPTETEWEYAARGNTGRLWSWGNLWRSSFANSLEGRVMQPSSVGAYPRNKSPYGVEDMIGNVWEWCRDWYDENEYRNRRNGVQDPRGPATCSARVLRGGSWLSLRNLARCSYRGRLVPDDFRDLIGFRLVCSPSSPSLHSESLHSESLIPQN